MESDSNEVAATSSPADPFEWLKEREGVDALEWVGQQNARTLEELTRDPRFPRYYAAALAVLREGSRSPFRMDSELALDDGWVYAFQRDEAHGQALWRRARFESFRAGAAAWEVLLDIDALSRAEGKSYGFMMSKRFGRRCMVALREADTLASMTWREFDLETRSFVKNGFELPASAATAYGSFVLWKDENTLYVKANFGPGTLSRTGDAFVLKEWTRGSPLASAREIFRGKLDEHLSWQWRPYTDETGATSLLIQTYDLNNRVAYWTFDANGSVVRVALPQGNIFGFHHGELLLRTYEDGANGRQRWKAGSLLSVPWADVTRAAPRMRLVMDPGGLRNKIEGFHATSEGVLLRVYENLRGRLLRARFRQGGWTIDPIRVPDNGTLDFPTWDPLGSTALVPYESFLEPRTLYEVDMAKGRATPLHHYSLPAQFDSSRYVTEQLEAASADGTRIPYFLVRPRALELNGDAAVLLHGYGSNGNPQYARYDGTLGRLWLDQGGSHVVANVRGGGEFGEAWHVRGVHRQHTYEDFIAVAHDLIRRRITSPRRLGIHGFSAGGLLVGVSITQHPQLFNAAVMVVPITDQFLIEPGFGGIPRNPREYGSLDDPGVRAFLGRTSPFQNLHKRDEFPVPFIATSTTDDDVHPMHPRRFAAKMERLGMPFYFYETPEGGHAVAQKPTDRARYLALMYTYLAQRLLDSPESRQASN